jgi:hypothetical protein
MILSKSEVEKLIFKGVSDEIKKSIKLSKEMNMHVTGKGAAEYLEGLDEYENSNQKILREKIMKSNKSVFSFILRPLDKIFSAKGGSINYNLKDTEINTVKVAVNEVADGLDIKRYLKKVVLKKYVIDPNGILFVDLDDEGQLSTSFIGSDEILWYKNKGNKVDAIIFQGEERIDADKVKRIYYRVIDDKLDRIFVKEPSPDTTKTEQVREVTGDRLDNFFGFVPAIIVGDVKNPNYNIFDSFISDINEEAKDLLHDVSINKIHKISQGFAKYWQRPEACTKCHGEGVIKYEETPGDDIWLETECNSCGGAGYKQKVSPSDVMIVPIAEKDEVDPAPNVAGYVNPSIEIWKKYDENIRDSRNYLYQVLWGTTFEQGGRNETATGRFIDTQPVQDRLRDISHTFSLLHQFILDCYGSISLNKRDYKSYVSYGTRYAIETPDEILKVLMEASREKVSDLILQDMRAKYFYAEYQNDDIELAKKQKLARIEPFPNMTITEVIGTELIKDEEKLMKIYFIGWHSTLTDADIILKDDNRLKEELNNYIKTKSNGKQTTVVQGNGMA